MNAEDPTVMACDVSSGDGSDKGLKEEAKRDNATIYKVVMVAEGIALIVFFVLSMVLLAKHVRKVEVQSTETSMTYLPNAAHFDPNCLGQLYTVSV